MLSHPRRRTQLPLTPRQHQILTLLKTPDLTRQQAAHQLNISLKTLNIHIHGALERLNVPNLTAALKLDF